MTQAISLSNEVFTTRRAIALLRITLGMIILATWWDNLNKGIYTAEGLVGLFNWLFDPDNGNASALTFYKALLDATILQIPGAFAIFQMIAELLMGLGLLVGGLTRLAGAGAALFFLNLLLAYFGGHEWIWTYVLLTMSALVVALTYAGREWGVDQILVQKLGEPPIRLLW